MSTSSLNENAQIQQQLIKNLNILYGGGQRVGQGTNNQFIEANKFLTEFRLHPQAWSVCITILSQINDYNNDHLQILNFSSQTVYDNILDNWRNVNIQQRMQIVTTLQKFIQSFSEKYLLSYLQNNNNNNDRNQHFRFIFNKTCQTIAFLALNAKQAINMIESVFNSCLSIKLPQQLSLYWVNLEILNAFALEFEQQHVSQSIIKETRDFLTTKYRDTFLKIVMFSLKQSQQSQNTLYRLIQISFALLRHWINIIDITLERMDGVGLLDEILNVIPLLYQSTDYPQATQFMVESMMKIIQKGITDTDHQNNYNNILNKLCLTFTKLEPILQKAIETNQIDKIRSLCNLICLFCEKEVKFIAKGENGTLNLVKMILQFTSHSSTMITTETFSFWSRLQDIGMNDRHLSLQKEVYVQLLRALLLHSTDPSEFDQHSRFRTNSSEIFISIYFTLQKQYFVEIEKQLKELFESIGNNTSSNQNKMNLILVGIESCIFALSEVSQEVMDQRNDQQIQQALNQYIKPICEALFNSKLHQSSINATSLHLLNQICSFFRGYSFYICNTSELLQKSLKYTIEIPTKYQPIMVYECSQCFHRLLYHSISIWMKQLNDFENIVKFVTEQIGQGLPFYNNLTQNQLDLLDDITISDITESDISVICPISRQQRGCALYYESICMVIDIYNDKNRQNSLINNLISTPMQICQSILQNLSNQQQQLTISIFYQLITNLRIFSAFIRGLKTTDTNNHPLIPHIEKILNFCVSLTKQIPPLISKQKQQQQQQQHIDNINLNMLYNAVCDIMEAVLDIFGSNTSNIVDGLVSMALEILKDTKSEASARILKKMVATFAKQTNLANNFTKLIKEAILYFNSDNIGDIRDCHKTVNEIFECVDIMLQSYLNTSEIWTQIVPNCIALSMTLLTKIQDRDGLRNALKILISIFDSTKYNQALNNIGNQLKKSLLPNLISIIFNGMAQHFERMIASKVYDLYYNLIKWDSQYLKQQTMIELSKLQLNAFRDDKNKELFINAFWTQRTDPRKFKLVLSSFFSVCHNYATVDCFGSMI